MTTKIQIISPVLFNKGDMLNGVQLAAPQWVHAGEVDIADDHAVELERTGYVDILSQDGAAVMWPSCCSAGNHTHG